MNRILSRVILVGVLATGATGCGHSANYTSYSHHTHHDRGCDQGYVSRGRARSDAGAFDVVVRVIAEGVAAMILAVSK